MRASEEIIIVLGRVGVPIGLTSWRAAVSRVNNGTGRGTVLIIGDSTSIGTGAGTGGTTNQNDAFPRGWTPQLATNLSSYVNTSFNSFISSLFTTVAYSAFDTRVTMGANWSNATTILGGQGFRFTPGAVNNLTFTPTTAFDTIILRYLVLASQGTATINVDGGASLGTITFTSGVAAITTQTFTVSKGTHTINLVPNNDALFTVMGMTVYDSTTPAIDVILGAGNGANSNTYIQNTAAWDAQKVIKAIAPDLLIVDLTINDSNAQTALSTYSANLQTIVTAGKLSGDVLLMVGPPSNTTQATNGTLDTYIAALKSVAASNVCSVVDMKALWGSYANIQATYPYFDTLHPKQAGYQGPPANGFVDIATAVTSTLNKGLPHTGGSPFIDNNGVILFIDDNSVTSFIDDNGITTA